MGLSHAMHVLQVNVLSDHLFSGLVFFKDVYMVSRDIVSLQSKG